MVCVVMLSVVMLSVVAPAAIGSVVKKPLHYPKIYGSNPGYTGREEIAKSDCNFGHGGRGRHDDQHDNIQ